MAYILGIESSCDETAASVVVDGSEVLSNVVASQIDKHAPHGGVVPELAAREHLKAIECVVKSALENANVSLKDISAISVTNGPGLMPALLVGVNFAKALAFANDISFIGANHFLAHIYGAFLDGKKTHLSEPIYPMLALVVSGGHSSLLLISDDGKARIIGYSIDDAAGEAFDKGAKLLGLGYPGGPIIEKTGQGGNISKYDFPRSLTGKSGKKVTEENKFNFSFSGLKTSLLYHTKKLQKENLLEDELVDTVASYQEAIVDVLTIKTKSAYKKFNAKSVVLCGGVACNGVLRERFMQTFDKDKLFIAPKKYCTDNAAMVAGIGYHLFKQEKFDVKEVDAYARLPLITEVPFIL